MVDFCLKNQDGKDVCLEDFRGKWLVFYFYPKDNTPGCTIEGIDFTKNIVKFKELNCEVVGVSPDSEKSHCKFIDNHKLKIELLCDPDKKAAKEFGAVGTKKMFGKEFEGIIRSTFLINPEGEIVHSWKNVRVNGHVEEVLNKLRELQ